MDLDFPVYVVVGEREEVNQVEIGGPFESSFHKEIVKIYGYKKAAEDFIDSNILKKPQKKPYSGAKYYKTGHYSLEIQEHYVS
jgi:hypothetical protein